MLIQVNALRKPLATSFCNIQTVHELKTLHDTKVHDIKALQNYWSCTLSIKKQQQARKQKYQGICAQRRAWSFFL